MLTRLVLIAIASTCVPASSVLAEARSLSAHQHGHVTLQIAVDGPDLEMMLEAPGADIVGFEHVAETEDQKAAVATALAALADPMALFALPEAAGCSGAATEVDLHQAGHHSAFEATYRLTCSDPSALARIETRLFDLYPSIEEIDVQYVTPAGQGTGELAPGAALPLPTS